MTVRMSFLPLAPIVWAGCTSWIWGCGEGCGEGGPFCVLLTAALFSRSAFRFIGVCGGGDGVGWSGGDGGVEGGGGMWCVWRGVGWAGVV